MSSSRLGHQVTARASVLNTVKRARPEIRAGECPVWLRNTRAQDSKHEYSQGDQKEHDWHAERVVARSHMGDDCTDKEQCEPNGSSNQGHADTDQQPQCTRCLKD